MSPTTTDTLTTGEELAEAGMKRVLSHELDGWQNKVRHYVVSLPRDFRFTMEHVIRQAGPPPVNPNSAGAMLSGLAKQKLIKWTGEVRRSTVPSRHAGIIRVWVRL